MTARATTTARTASARAQRAPTSSSRHARARRATFGACGPSLQSRSPARPLAAPKPAIVEKPIPFGAHRRAETAAYAQRHYGLRHVAPVARRT